MPSTSAMDGSSACPDNKTPALKPPRGMDASAIETPVLNARLIGLDQALALGLDDTAACQRQRFCSDASGFKSTNEAAKSITHSAVMSAIE
jgi:hypothetical protein